MIDQQFYLTDTGALERACELTELSVDEVEKIVGKFRSDHWRFAGLLRGEVVEYFDGRVEIRHHFTKKVLWSDCTRIQ